MPLAALDFGRGRVLSVADALELAAAGELDDEWTYAMLNSLLSVQQDRGDRISTTTLTAKCPRSEVLKRTRPYTDEAKKLYPAWRGTMFHGQAEVNAHPDDIAEARYYVTLPTGDLLSGSPDLVSPRLGRLYDYKTSEDPPSFYPWEDHVTQVQINRWLVDHAHTVEWQFETFPLTGKSFAAGKTRAAERAHNRARFVPKEWDSLWLVYLAPKKPVPMKVTRSEKVPTKAGGLKNARVADIWSDERVEELVYVKYAERKAALSGDVIPPIPAGFERQMHPLCQWCPVRKDCWELAMQGN